MFQTHETTFNNALATRNLNTREWNRNPIKLKKQKTNSAQIGAVSGAILGAEVEVIINYNILVFDNK